MGARLPFVPGKGESVAEEDRKGTMMAECVLQMTMRTALMRIFTKLDGGL